MSLTVSTRAFPAERSVLPEIRRFVEAEARRRDFPDTVGDLVLAVTEACSNSVRHAYEEGRDGVVQVSYRLRDDRIEVEVADDGAGFDPTVLERAQRELDEGGLGIAIIRAVTDELEIGSSHEGRGSRLRFTKFLN